MPRRKKRKPRRCEKSQKAQGATQLQSSAKGKANPSSAPPPVEVTTQKKSGARSRSTVKRPRKATSTTAVSAGGSPTKVPEGAKRKGQKKQKSSQAPGTSAQSQKDPLKKVTGMLVQFLMHMYNMKKPIMKADMLKIVKKKFKKRFPEILRRASVNIEMVFGVDLKEADSTQDSYILVSKMDLPHSGRVRRGKGFPKTGLLMHLLAVIFLKGNRATEEIIWEFLNKMKIYAGKRHFLFGEPKKLITQNLVKLKYLEYQQVPNSDPPRYEFLWGPRAHAETSKMKVLEFWAKINNTVPSAFSSCYEEALHDEEEKGQATAAPSADAGATAVSESGPCSTAPPTPSEVEVESSK